jgi:hypothetical protein
MCNFIHGTSTRSGDYRCESGFVMKNECPEWAVRIGAEVRLLAQEHRCKLSYLTSLLRKIDAREFATTSDDEGLVQLVPVRSIGSEKR